MKRTIWDIKDGEKYYRLCANGKIDRLTWVNDFYDRKFAAQAPCFSYGVSGAVAGFH